MSRQLATTPPQCIRELDKLSGRKWPHRQLVSGLGRGGMVRQTIFKFIVAFLRSKGHVKITDQSTRKSDFCQISY